MDTLLTFIFSQPWGGIYGYLGHGKIAVERFAVAYVAICWRGGALDVTSGR